MVITGQLILAVLIVATAAAFTGALLAIGFAITTRIIGKVLT